MAAYAQLRKGRRRWERFESRRALNRVSRLPGCEKLSQDCLSEDSDARQGSSPSLFTPSSFHAEVPDESAQRRPSYLVSRPHSQDSTVDRPLRAESTFDLANRGRGWRQPPNGNFNEPGDRSSFVHTFERTG